MRYIRLLLTVGLPHRVLAASSKCSSQKQSHYQSTLAATMHNFVPRICPIIYQTNYDIALFFALGFQMCVGFAMPFDQLLYNLRFPCMPHRLFVIRHFEVLCIVLAPCIPRWVDAFRATGAEDVNSGIHVFIRPHKH